MKRYALWLLLGLLGLLGFSPTAMAVGALTPFNQANSLDLAAYCDGTDSADDTACMRRWIGDAKAQGRHLYVSGGTYHYTKGMAIFNGFQLRCAATTPASFKSVNSGSLFVLAANWGVTGEPWRNMRLEQCGFDLNGATANFAGVLAMAGNTQPVRHVTVRANRVFDSTQPGSMYLEGNRQRQYIAITNAEDILVEDNQLSEGGRIKVGRPGRRLTIRNNTLHNINDNAITVVDHRGVSEDILITGNTITNPLGSGIFFGVDGQQQGIATTTTRHITITDNVIQGDWKNNCITGVLPNVTHDIMLAHNVCHKTGTRGTAAGGIGLGRSVTGLDYVTGLTLEHNTISATVATALKQVGAIFASDRFTNLCILHNVITNNPTAIRLRSAMPVVKLTGNDLGGGRLSLGATVHVDQSGDTTGCVVAP